MVAGGPVACMAIAYMWTSEDNYQRLVFSYPVYIPQGMQAESYLRINFEYSF